jgi:hypothetical protein
VWRKLQPIVPAPNTSVPAHFDAIQDRQRGHGERDNVIPTVTIGPRTRRPGARRFRTTHAGPPSPLRSPPEWLIQAAGDSWQVWAQGRHVDPRGHDCR